MNDPHVSRGHVLMMMMMSPMGIPLRLNNIVLDIMTMTESVGSE